MTTTPPTTTTPPQTLDFRSPSTPINRLSFLAQVGPVVGLLCIIIYFSIAARRTFPTVSNAQIILMQTAVVGTAALGMTVVIVSGGIDLSVGSVIALTSVIVAILLRAGAPPLVAAAGGVLAGCAAGAVNGLLITQLKLMPFIVTLGTMAFFRGLTENVGNNETVLAPHTWLDRLIRMLDRQHQWQLLPPGVWITIVLALVVAVALRYLRLGRHVFAIGSNEQTARLCGVNVKLTKTLVYCVGGLFAGLAGVLQFSSLTVGDTTTANGMELDVIAAVVIGGASLNGGQGSIFGTLVGALIMSVVANGCVKLGLGNDWQKMVTGGIIVLAVAIDRLQHRER